MNKNYFTLLLLSLVFCFTQAQTTHFIDWDLNVGANATITIDVGDTIEWTNVDIGMPHDVTSSDPNAPAGFGSGILGDNDTYSFTFNTAVVFDYGCSIHPGSMDGTITVLAAGSCDAPTNLTLNGVTDTTADFSWTASPDETGGYNWAVMTVGQHPNANTPVQMGNTLTGVNNAMATGLVASTHYDFFVQTDCGVTTTSIWAGPLNFMTDTGSPTYCIPSYQTAGCTDGDVIDDFEIFAAGFSHLATGCSSTSYADYTGDPALEINLQAGVNYDFEITHGYGTQRVRIWIDFNQDGVFDHPGEMVSEAQSVGTGSGATYTEGIISIPPTAPLVTTRMRVMTRFNTMPLPCDNIASSSWGETHDYTVNIIPAAACDAPTNLTLNNVTDTTADFSWTASPDETGGYNWVVMLMGDDPNTDPPVAQGTTATGITTATASGLTPDTMYMAYVKTLCDMGVESSFSSPLHFMTEEEECEAITNLTINNVTETVVSFSWTEPANTGNVLGYGAIIVLTGNIPFVDNHVAEELYNVGVTSATIDELQSDTTYDLYMASVCSMTPIIISDFEMVTFTTDEGMNVSDNDRIRLNYYPNPTTEILMLESQYIIEGVEVFNLRGQKILGDHFNRQSIQLDFSNFAEGVYLLKATFENGATKAIKVVKE